MMNELEDHRVGRVHSNLGCKKNIVYPACIVGMAKGLVTSFG